MADSAGQEATAVASGKPAKRYDITELKDLQGKAKAVRERFIPDWYLNTAFYLGQQWLYWNRGRLDRPHLEAWRRTPVDNRILPVVWARAARKVKTRPAFEVTPFTADEADIDAAKLGELVLDADWINLDLQEKLFQAILHSEICGAGFWKVTWDSTAGESAEFLVDPQGNPVTQANGAPIKAEMLGQVPEGMTTKRLAQGDVAVDVLSPFEVYPDPLATTLEECEWIIEEKIRSAEYVKKRYGADLEPDAPAPVGPVESRLFATAQYTGGYDAEEYKGVRLFELWMRPSTEYPTGKRCVWARDALLAEDDAPNDPMPYVMFTGVRSPNRFWPTSITSQLRGPQTELNKIQAQIMENAARIGNPALMKSRQANVRYTGKPGEEILFDSTVPDARPEYLQPPDMPTYVREQVQRITESITEISGIHEVSNATVPSGVTAASAINLLQEADDTRLGPEIQAMEVSLGEAGSKILALRAQFNTDERLIRLAGEDGNWDIVGFRGAALRESTDVEVQAGSAMPRSKAAKQAAMLEVLQTMFQYGIELDPRDLRRFFKDYEVGALERLFETISEDEAQVQRENRQMSQGMAVNINDWDDDEIHVAGHNEFRKTARFMRLPPPIQNIISVHVQAHQERMVQVVHSQMTAQQQEGQMQEQQAMDQQMAAAPPEQAAQNGGGSGAVQEQSAG